MKAKDKLQAISTCILVLMVMGIIYGFSAQPSNESRQLSRQFIDSFVSCINNIPLIPDRLRKIWLASPGFYVRKLAHLMIYTLLGAVTLTALSHFKVSCVRQTAGALLICMVYAMLDEWHQYFVDGRTASLKDVMIDTTGAFIGILIVILVKTMISSVIKYQNKKKKLK